MKIHAVGEMKAFFTKFKSTRNSSFVTTAASVTAA